MRVGDSDTAGEGYGRQRDSSLQEGQGEPWKGFKPAGDLTQFGFTDALRGLGEGAQGRQVVWLTNCGGLERDDSSGAGGGQQCWGAPHPVLLLVVATSITRMGEQGRRPLAIKGQKKRSSLGGIAGLVPL